MSDFQYDALTSDDLDQIMTLAEKARFYTWIGGQTCVLIKAHGKETIGYYSHDVKRFLEYIRFGGENYFD